MRFSKTEDGSKDKRKRPDSRTVPVTVENDEMLFENSKVIYWKLNDKQHFRPKIIPFAVIIFVKRFKEKNVCRKF